jgi:NitT/TauT family transport system substrate-binding protein
MPIRRRSLAALALVAGLGLAAPSSAEVSEIRITRQPSIVYLPLVVMEQAKLLEKRAAEAGLGDIKVNWITFTSGGASTEALLSGNVDLVTSGVSNLLLLWDRTRGEVKGVAAAAAVPMVLVTRNPDVKTIADFTEKDRIAVPTLKISMQAIMLQMAAEKAFGAGGRNKLDPMTIQLGHPDATIAVLNPRHEVNSHYSLPPYLNLALKDPKVHVVLNSRRRSEAR